MRSVSKLQGAVNKNILNFFLFEPTYIIVLFELSLQFELMVVN